jgi:hypothetical protein
MEQETRNREERIKRTRHGTRTLVVPCSLLLVSCSLLLVSCSLLLGPCLLLLVSCSPVFAAEISFDSKNSEVVVGQQFQVDVVLNTEGEAINAIEGRVVFPNNLLEVKEVREGNSIVSLWVERPRLAQSQIPFAGIIPGGYKGNNGLLLTIIFTAKEPGQGTVELQNLKALLNDGQGTATAVNATNFQFSISESGAPLMGGGLTEIRDNEPPETFRPEIAKSDLLFNGKWFVVFTTADKKSGIDHYEIKESRQRFLSFFSKWLPAESPYLLKDQERRSYVWIKAVDKAGNQRIERIRPQYPLRWYENYENWIIIVLGLIVAYAGYKETRNRGQGTRDKEHGTRK